MEDKHEGIITKEEFQKAQEIFYKTGKTKKVIPKTYPLYRKVKCGICGRAMSYRTFPVMELSTGILFVRTPRNRLEKMVAARGMLLRIT